MAKLQLRLLGVAKLQLSQIAVGDFKRLSFTVTATPSNNTAVATRPCGRGWEGVGKKTARDAPFLLANNFNIGELGAVIFGFQR